MTAPVVYAAESPNIGNLQIFPPDNAWNWDISNYAVHANSANFINSIGANGHLHPDFGTVWDGAPNGIPYMVVDGSQPQFPITYTAYGDESDAGPFPIPLYAPIEGGDQSDGDRHVIVIDTTNAMLYELYRAFPQHNYWEAESGAKYDLTSNALRPDGWTSADAAGLPIFPGLVRYEEVYLNKKITHALRFTVAHTQRKYIYPARHYASSSTDADLPPMGLRLRLKADFDINEFSEPVQVILTALKKYGMIVADNGSDWFISGAPDDRWDDEILGELKSITGDNFEVVQTVDASGNPIFPEATYVQRNASLPGNFNMHYYPNPFNAQITLHYHLPLAEMVKLQILNLSGRTLTTLVNQHQPGGEHIVRWQADYCASGLYFFRLETLSESITGKIVLCR